MNTLRNYTLVSRSGTKSPFLGWLELSRGTLSAIMLLTDMAVVVAMSFVSGIVYHSFVYDGAGVVTFYLEIGVITGTVFTIANLVRGEYVATNLFAIGPGVGRILHLWNVTFVSLLLIGFLTKTAEVYSRGSTLLFYAATFPVLLGFRYLVIRIATIASRSGLLCVRRVFLFGTGGSIREFIERCEPRRSGLAIVGCRFVTPLGRQATTKERLASLQEDLDAAMDNARALAPEAIVLMMPWSASESIDACVERFLALPVEIHLGPDRILHRFEDVHLSRFGSFTSLQLIRMPLTWVELALKRTLDLAVASSILFALTPALLLTALLIKLDSRGPVFFLQRRYGFNQRPFRIIKFRTMHTMEDGNVVRQATREDARITRVGRWLRRWSIDEIPQLFNIIMGDMSLVGPRPHALSHDREYGRKIAIYARRHKVKPGITGWAQVNGFRGETDTDEKMEQRIAHDLYYIENWSLSFDLRILIQTAISPSAYNNAY